MMWSHYRKAFLAGSLVCLMSSSFSVFANDDLDVTMRMVTSDDEVTESVAREIRLSAPIGLEDNPGQANDVAREAREKGREFGQNTAAQAKEAAQFRRDERETPSSAKPDTPSQRP